MTKTDKGQYTAPIKRKKYIGLIKFVVPGIIFLISLIIYAIYHKQVAEINPANPNQPIPVTKKVGNFYNPPIIQKLQQDLQLVIEKKLEQQFAQKIGAFKQEILNYNKKINNNSTVEANYKENTSISPNMEKNFQLFKIFIRLEQEIYNGVDFSEQLQLLSEKTAQQYEGLQKYATQGIISLNNLQQEWQNIRHVLYVKTPKNWWQNITEKLIVVTKMEQNIEQDSCDITKIVMKGKIGEACNLVQTKINENKITNGRIQNWLLQAQDYLGIRKELKEIYNSLFVE